MSELSRIIFEAADYEGLAPEKQSATAFNWISRLNRELRRLASPSSEDQHHVSIQLNNFFDFVQGQKEQQFVTKRIRDSIAKAYELLYSSESSKSLYETANKLVSYLGKLDKYSELKHLAVVSLGSINATCGEKIVSLAPMTAISLIKQLKNSTHTGFRYSLLMALKTTTNVTGDTYDETLSKDTWKIARNLALDKSAKVSSAAFHVLEALANSRVVFKSNSDFEQFKSLYLKAMESPFAIVRQSAAKCFAYACLQLINLSKTKAELQPKKSKSSSKSKKAAGVDEDDDEAADSRTASPAPTGKIKAFHSMSFSEIIKLFVSCYTLNGVSSRTRTGVAQTIAYFITLLKPEEVEARYFEITHGLLTGIVAHPGVKMKGYTQLNARKHLVFILNDIIAKQVLGEVGQLNAIKILTNEILKNYPAVLKEQVEPSPEVLIATCEVIQGLIKNLRSAVASNSATTEALKLTLVQLLDHPNHSVQINASSCLKELVLVVPANIVPLLTSSLNHVTKELPLLAKKQGNSYRIIGHAYLASILVSLTNAKPEYCSLDLTSRVLTTATGLLKTTHEDVGVQATHIQVAWLLISGLMSLGPSFVKIHLSQLLLLWKAALYKPVGKDQNPADKGSLELSYHLHVRHCALGSIVAFLAFNSKLVTADVSRRIGVMLQNTSLFSNAIPSKKYTEDAQVLSSTMTLHDYDTITRRRILQCYLYLSTQNHAGETFPANLLTSALSTFADPEKSNAKLSTAIAAGAGTINSLWEVADNYAYGVTSKVRGFDIIEMLNNHTSSSEGDEDQSLHWLSETPNWCGELENGIQRPIITAPEFDADSFFFLQLENCAVPANTAVVDLSIELFTGLLPKQTPKVQESILDQLRTNLSTAMKKSNNGQRKNAVVVNTVATIYGTLRNATRSATDRESLKRDRVLNILVDIVKKTLVDADPFVRNLSAQSMGMICSLGGSTTTTAHIKYLIDEIVSNRDPNARGGSSIALGYILKHVGGMFAGLHLKTVLGILVSLAGDPHPTVHFWALEAISITIASSGLSFSNYTSSTLSTLVKLYLLESHGDEGTSTVSTNMDVELSTTQIISRCVRALINVFGPDLRESSKSRNSVLNLVQYFELSDDERIVVEAYKSVQELIIFAADTVDIEAFGKNIHRHAMIRDENALLRGAAIDGLYQLIRTQSTRRVFEICGKDLDIDIWLAYDNTPDCKELRRFIEYWLDQSGESEPVEWILRIQSVLLKTRTAFDPRSVAAGKVGKNAPASSGDNDAGLMGDEEGESFNSKSPGSGAGAGGSSGMHGEDSGGAGSSGAIDEPLKWQTRELAIRLLRKLVYMMLKNKSIQQKEASPMVAKVGDLIKIAFLASTASVLELRLLGLKLLDDILTELKDLVDPDFTEVALLEQYQAQIGSALTPAFSADSSPELAFQAIKVCATFIGSGIIKNVDRMGRILNLLTNALESCSGSQIITLGELKSPSPNAQVMLRIAVLSLWAELQVSSVESGQEYLVDVVKPHVSTLIPLWIAALRDFAKLRFEPEQSSGLGSGSNSSQSGGFSGSLDQMYSALSRASVLPIYQESWLQLVDAIASLIEGDSRLVFDILDEKERATAETEEEGIKYSNEPAAFFFVLFGLCFEALVRPQSAMGSLSSSETRLKVLIAMKRILHPSVSGTAVYKDVIFAETIDMIDRIVLTGDVKEQQAVVEIVTSLCLNHPGRSKTDEEAQSEQISESVDQLFECFRVVMLAVTNMFPFLSDSDRPISRHATQEAAHLTLIRSCLDSLVSMIEVFPNIIKVDLYSCLLYVFGRFLEDEQCQKNIVPYSLVVQKKLLAVMMHTRKTCQNSGPVIERAVTTAITHVVGLLGKSSDADASGLARRRNCILSAAIVVTTCTDALDTNGQFVRDLCSLLLENISVPQVAQISAECMRTLLVSCINHNIGKVFAERMIPSLVTIATSNDKSYSSDSASGSDPSVETPSLVPKLVNDVLVGFTKGMPAGEERVVSGMTITIPTLIQFIGDKTCGIPADQRLAYVKAKLFDLAGYDSAAFKKVVQGGLSEWQRTLLEKILRDGQQESGSEEALEEKSSGDHIQLKSFG